MGCIRGCSNDVWIKNGTDDFPTNYHRDLRRLYSGIHVSLPRRLCRVWSTTGTPHPITTLSRPQSPSSVELKPSQMCVFCDKRHSPRSHRQPGRYCHGPRQSTNHPECPSARCTIFCILAFCNCGFDEQGLVPRVCQVLSMC